LSLFELLGGGIWRKLSVGIVASAVAGLLYTSCIKLVNDLLSTEEVLWYNVLLLIGTISMSLILSVYSGRFMTIFFENKIAELRIDLSKKIMKADFEQVERNAYRILPVLQNDVQILINFAKTIPDMVVSVFKILAIWIYMLWVSWQMTVFLIGVFALVFLFNYFLLGRIYIKEVLIKKYHNDIHHSLEGMVLGLKDLTLNRQHSDGYIDRIIGPTSFLHAAAVSGLNTYNIILTKSAEWIVIVAIALFTVAIKVFGFLPVGQVSSFMTMIVFILPSLIVATSFLRSRKRVKVATDQIMSLGLNFESEKDELKKAFIASTNQASKSILIDMKGLGYTYTNGDESYSVGPIDLEIYQNEVLLINGGNGSGKTTFSKLITGLYTPGTGKISYQEKQVTEKNKFDYRNLFSAVFTDTYVFNDLNYLAGNPSLKSAENYMQQLSLNEKITLQELVISDTNLSFGQRGRINLFRALLEDKSIYLFDEWAANQDPHFREKFYSEIIPMLKQKGKTVILISHDDKYYHLADRVVTFSSGRIKSITHQSSAK
jgi:putative ATP-binding cassette transporter